MEKFNGQYELGILYGGEIVKFQCVNEQIDCEYFYVVDVFEEVDGVIVQCNVGYIMYCYQCVKQ